MKKSAGSSLLMVILLISCALPSKAQFTISGEFRPRLEYRNGYLLTGDSSMKGTTDILGRSRIIFDFTNEKIMTRFSLQHAFTFGENNYSSDTITKNTVNIFEGWFRYSFQKNLAVKIGRTTVSYDDQRLFGLSNWKQQGATHDLVMMQTGVPGINYKADFGFAINNMAPAPVYQKSYDNRNYKYMSYLWQQKKFFNDALAVSVTAILDVNQKPSSAYNKTTMQTIWVTNGNDTVGSFQQPTVTKVTEYYPSTMYGRGTIGFHAAYTLKKLGVTASAYYQGGHFKDGRKIEALMLAGTVSYQFTKWFRLMAGDDFLSGNDLSDTSTYKTKLKGFSTLWGTNHSFYGYMDTYTAYLGRDALQYGLNDLFFRATFDPLKNTSIEATYRMFSMPYGYLPGTKTGTYKSVDKGLGSEFDLMIIYKPLPNLEINGAYCVYFRTDTKDLTDGLVAGTGQTGHYAYFMITYKPEFFRSDKK